MKREFMIRRLQDAAEPGRAFDILIVGGGASGVGAAVDAASRGHRVALLERSDFGKGTSSRSTKLVHGGVRYLQQGNVPLVMEALKERGLLRQNAPHLVHDLAFVVPNYAWWEAPFYGIGMKVYDALAGRYGFGPSKNLSADETIARLPTLETDGLRGGVVYHDGQFDDARLLIDLVQTAAEQGAVVANYVSVDGLMVGDDGFLEGVRATDRETGESLEVAAKVVVNATGAWSDELRQVDNPKAKARIRPSQGVHVVLPKSFLPGDSAIMVPHTDDGRILFAIPWLGTVVVGTTDTPIEKVGEEPVPFDEEVDFLLEHAARYLTEDPSRADVLSVFAGIRPLVAGVGDEDDTSKISREHTLHVSSTGLLTIAGGKWTTYRKMAEDVVDHAETVGGLAPRDCVTKRLNIHGYHEHAEQFGELAVYGSDAPEVQAALSARPGYADLVHPALSLRRGEIAWAATREMARTVDDVLARRSRSLLRNARASIEAAPAVADFLAEHLGRDDDWIAQQVRDFTAIAEGYCA